MSKDSPTRLGSQGVFLSCVASLLLLLAGMLHGAAWYMLPASAIVFISLCRLHSLRSLRFGYFDVRILTWLVLLYTQGISPFLNDFLDYYLSLWRLDSNDQLKVAMAPSAAVSLAGVMIFAILERLFLKEPPVSRPLEIRKRRFLPVLTLFLAISGITQIYIFASFGGLAGYLNAWTDDKAAFDGYGWLYMIAEAFPILVVFTFAAYYLAKARRPPIKYVFLVLLAFIFFKLLFGGFRGSRANTLWGMFWALGIINVYFYSITRKVLLVLLAVGFTFVVTYSLYKSYGVEIFQRGISVSELETTGRYDGRPVAGVLLEDFSRSGIQAAVINAYANGSTYQLKYGETYMGALALPIPGAIYPGSKPTTKIQAGTELLYGTHYTAAHDRHSTRIFGIFGEGVLNFSPWFAPLTVIIVFLVYIAIIKYFHSMRRDDPRLLLYPLAVTFMFIIVVSDSDNAVFFLIKNGALPALAVMLISRRKSFSPA